jgi:hypothetical protein
MTLRPSGQHETNCTHTRNQECSLIDMSIYRSDALSAMSAEKCSKVMNDAAPQQNWDDQTFGERQRHQQQQPREHIDR